MSATAFFLQEIRLVQFRCFESLVFRPQGLYNFVIGQNAQGKTSLLEAICVLLRLQSPRTYTLSQTVCHGRAWFSLEGSCSGCHLRLRYGAGHRELQLNSLSQSSSHDYLSVARVAWFANSDLELIRGSGSGRRRYLDFLGAQMDPEYLPYLRAYERAWKSRNTLLKEGARREEIRAFNEPLAIAGEAIAARRASITKELRPLFRNAAQDISGTSESLDIGYQSGFRLDFRSELLASELEEQRVRHTVIGVHRDELKLSISGMPASAFASEGQQRTIALALKLAQVRLLATRTKSAPILLLDDVFGELDVERRERLLDHLPVEAQKIVTATSLKWLGNISEAAIFRIGQGQLVYLERTTDPL